MKLNLGKIHRIIGQVLGAEAVTLQNFITRVQEDAITCGVLLGGDGVLYYDPDWWNEHIDTPEKARHVVLAEIMKNILGIQYRRADWISKIAAGAVINSYLYNVFGYHELPAAMYSAKTLPECLMRPRARGYHSRLKRIYRGIWDREERFTNVANVEHALRVIFGDPNLIPEDVDPNDIDVPGFMQGMGSGGEGEDEGEGQGSGSGGTRTHGHETDGGKNIKDIEKSDRLPSSVMEHMAEGLEQQQQSAGYSNVMRDHVVERMRTKKTLETIMVEDFVLDRIKKKIRKTFEPDEPEQSMLPIKITKNEAFKMAMGWTPLWFEQQTEKEKEDGEGGLAVYMDVSGSFTSFIPYTLGVLQAVEDMVEKIYQFSNKVAEIPFEDIKGNKVRIHSTGGTDFDCVGRHAVDENYDKILIITDGWADVNNEKIREEMSAKINKVLVLMVTRLPTSKNPRVSDEQTVKMFLESTWLGQRYGSCTDLAEAFKDTK